MEARAGEVIFALRPRGRRKKEGRKAAMDFFEIDGGASTLTDAECVRIAERGGVLPHPGSQYALPRAVERFPRAPEWGSRRVATRGTDNGGDLVLVGLTPRTRRILRAAKVAQLIARGIDETIAAHAVSVAYGLEPGVAELALVATKAATLSGRFDGRSHRAFERWLGVPSSDGLSFWRRQSAAEIAWRACGGLQSHRVAPPSDAGRHSQ
jgi:hypothetical protein